LGVGVGRGILGVGVGGRILGIGVGSRIFGRRAAIARRWERVLRGVVRDGAAAVRRGVRELAGVMRGEDRIVGAAGRAEHDAKNDGRDAA
jgi:hypothetical protein